MPSQITTGADKEYKITYTYDALGRKLQAYYRRKTMDVIIPKRQQARSITLSSRFDGIIGKPVLPDTLVKDTMSTAPSEAEWLSSKITYSGNLIFTGNRVTVLNPHGYTTIDTNKTTGEQTTTRYYYLKDHLGSNRVVFRGDGTVVQQNHYYAYGGLTEESTGGTQQSYKYNGKEFDRKLGLDLYDYGARWYDPVGSSAFTTIDPLCEEDYSVSPYVYCGNNPARYIDPDGREIRGQTKKDTKQVIEDIKAIFAAEEFSNFRNLIVQSGKRQNGKSLAKIDENALKTAFDGINLSEDQQALVEIVVNTINSNDIHKIGHEIFGHGRSLALGRTTSQHADSIQAENLIRRVMNINLINDGSNHDKKSYIPNPTSLPSYR